MNLLYLLEDARTPFFNAFFSLITLLGEEVAFMAIGVTVLWCFSKTKGYFLLITGFFGTLINQFLKIIFKIPRPFVKDKNFTIVESAREGASGFSFPSGHTQSSVTLFGGIARSFKGKLVKVISITLAVLVPFSRLYLGVHTPLDVGVSILISLALIFSYPLFEKAQRNDNIMLAIILTLNALSIFFLLYVFLFPFDSFVYLEENVQNLYSAQKNACTLLGCAVGLLVVYPLEKKFVNFETKAVWWAQILKVIIGLIIILGVKEGLKLPLEFIFNNELLARAVRYFIMVLIGGGIWPMTFKWFSKLGRK